MSGTHLPDHDDAETLLLQTQYESVGFRFVLTKTGQLKIVVGNLQHCVDGTMTAKDTKRLAQVLGDHVL
jgi:hypothetical protein